MLPENLELINPILLAATSIVDFVIVNKNDRPSFGKGVVFAPFIPYDLAENKGVQIFTLLDGRYKTFQDGENTNEDPTMKTLQPLVRDVDDKEFLKGGIAIVSFKTDQKLGSFVYSCSTKDAPVELKITKGQALILNRDCMIKFNPVDKEILWKAGDVSLQILAWDGSDDSAVGSVASLNDKSDAFSEKAATVLFVRQGCEGRINECKRKCPAADQKYGQYVEHFEGEEKRDRKISLRRMGKNVFFSFSQMFSIILCLFYPIVLMFISYYSNVPLCPFHFKVLKQQEHFFNSK